MRAAVLCIALMASAPVAAQDVALANEPLLPDAITWRASSDSACAAARRALERSATVRSRARAVQLPGLHGEPTRAWLDRWARRELAPFLERARRDLDRLYHVARRVLETGCYVESIEALADYGRAYEALVVALADLPEASDVDDALRGLYGRPSDNLTWPQRMRARDIYATGLRLARVHRAYGPASQACADGLVRLGALLRDHELVSHRIWVRPADALHVIRNPDDA